MNTDAEAGLIERRWSATVRAVRRMQAECEVLREVTELAEASWRHAREQRQTGFRIAHRNAQRSFGDVRANLAIRHLSQIFNVVERLVESTEATENEDGLRVMRGEVPP